MVAYAGFSQPATPFLGEVRQRILISLLAAFLALIDLNVMPHAAPGGARGDFSTLVGVGGTRVKLACSGNGPVTVAMIGPSGLTTAIDDGVQDRIARSARLCSVTLAEATSRTTPNLSRLLASTLYSARVPAPYVIVSHALDYPASDQPLELLPFGHLIAGWVLINPMPPPATGTVIRSDGATWSLPIGERENTALGILSLFWPPDDVPLDRQDAGPGPTARDTRR